MNNSRNYFLAFLNQAIFDSGVSRDGPIFFSLAFESDFGLDFDFALAAKFLALSVVFFAADWVAALALDAVALALAGAFFAAAFALAGAALAAFFAAGSFAVLEATALRFLPAPLRLARAADDSEVAEASVAFAVVAAFPSSLTTIFLGDCTAFRRTAPVLPIVFRNREATLFPMVPRAERDLLLHRKLWIGEPA